MKFITENALKSIDDEYYEEGTRYLYLKEVIDQIKLMDNINTTLELGPYKSPLIEGGDVLDITDEYLMDYPIKIGKLYTHNGSVTPYPFENKKYDLVIACQVLEHLGTNQREVFKELCRISKKAIITLPYKWNTPCDMHHMIDRDIIDNWANGLKPVFEKMITKPYPYRARILRIYNFDDEDNLDYNKKIQEHADFQISNKLVQEQIKTQELENMINNLNVENKKLQQQFNDKLKTQKEGYDNQLKNQKLRYEEKIRILEKQGNIYADNLKVKEHIINEIMQSNSWKLTTPLRKLGKWLKNR